MRRTAAACCSERIRSRSGRGSREGRSKGIRALTLVHRCGCNTEVRVEKEEDMAQRADVEAEKRLVRGDSCEER